MRTRTFVLVLAAQLALVGCRTTTPAPAEPEKPEAPPAPPPPAEKQVSLSDVGLDASAMDKTADPCQDFYRYACGGWLDKTEIPADRSRWARSFSVINEENLKTLRQILEESASGKIEEPDAMKIGVYYASCMDEKSIEKKGLKGIAALLKPVRAVKDRKSLYAAITFLHRHRVWVVFDVSAEQDFKDATQVIAYLDQSGLGLPDRDYYLSDEPKQKALRDSYRAHVEKMFRLAGRKAQAAKRAAADVMNIETELAKVSMPRVERRDPYNLYHKMAPTELKQLAASFTWDRYLAGIGLKDVQSVNVTAPDFFKGFDALAGKVKPAAWRNYLEWHVLADAAGANALPQKFVDETFRMRQTLTGQKAIEARWKRCVASTDGALGDLLAKYYVKRKFAGESKPEAEQIVHGVSDAFGENLGSLSWMDAPTRAKAQEKLEKMVYKIGYPDKWKTYPFGVSMDEYAANYFEAQAHEFERDMKKIGKPLDRTEWFMTAPTVNAYYNPGMNEMVFPAGILQPPFFEADFAAAANLGGIGMVMGHELTHGFDDEGSKFDAYGNLDKWWTPEVRKQFEGRTQCVVDQYSKYEPVEGVTLDGKLTLGENIADIGGVKLSHLAFRHLREGAKETLVADGLNEDQLFFLAFAQSWCSKDREALARLLVKVDPHSPARFRVNGALADVPAFAEAYQCASGTPMHPENVCSVW